MDTIICIVRWAGGVAALVMTLVITISVVRFRSRSAGKTVGSSPARLYSPIFLVIASLISIGVGVLLWRPMIANLPGWVEITQEKLFTRSNNVYIAPGKFVKIST